MGLLVQKFGGTSVATPERMREIAEQVRFRRLQGDDVVLVVRAMGVLVLGFGWCGSCACSGVGG